MALTVVVPVDDSPKFYYMLRDIYGNPIGLKPSDFTSLSYTVYKSESNSLIPVDGFENVAISPEQYHETPLPYPDNIKGVTASELEAGYNLEVFPYAKAETGNVWKSPFAQLNATYVLAVTASYYMTDSALLDVNLIAKTYSVTVQTRG